MVPSHGLPLEGGDHEEEGKRREIKSAENPKLGLPDLEHAKTAVLDSLRSPESQRWFTLPRKILESASRTYLPNSFRRNGTKPKRLVLTSRRDEGSGVVAGSTCAITPVPVRGVETMKVSSINEERLTPTGELGAQAAMELQQTNGPLKPGAGCSIMKFPSSVGAEIVEELRGRCR
jgi:hypothetical protein